MAMTGEHARAGGGAGGSGDDPGQATEPGVGSPDPLGRFEGTGDPSRLEEALTALEQLPAEEHAPVYERLHAELRRLLDREPSEVPEGLLRGVRAAEDDAGPGPVPEDPAP